MSHFIPIAVQTGLVVARVLVAGVFVAAGIAKLTNNLEARQALVDFGLPMRLARPIGILLPLGEILIGLAVLPLSTARWGAGGALALLTLFTISVSLTLARGKAPSCRCFGQLSAAPVGPHTLVRNGVLIFAAAFIAIPRVGPGPSLVDWLQGDLTSRRVTIVGCLAGVAVLGVVVLLLAQILRQQGRILLRLDALEGRGAGGPVVAQADAAPAGLPVGFPAPSFQLDALDGKAVDMESLLAGRRPVLLLFTNPNCGPCHALLPEISQWQLEHSAELSIVLVSEGTVADNRHKVAEHGIRQLLLQKEREVADAYQAWGTPAALLILTDGSIGSPLAQGADAIRALVEQSVLGVVPARAGLAPRPTVFGSAHGNGHRSPAPPASGFDDLPPTLKVRDLNGNSVSLAAFRGLSTLLLFWNPSCGFCQKMVTDLRAWDASSPVEAPRLLVLSTGSAAEGCSLGLRSQVLLDPGGQIASAFGAHGTPMAVLLDPDCRKASDIAAGSEAVFALANSKVNAKRETA